MRTRGVFAIAFLALSAVQSAAADLNAPLVDKPTIKSEMLRGVNTSLYCAKNLVDRNVMNDCLAAAESRARREQTDPSPFLLGLYVRSLLLYLEMEDWREVSRSYPVFASLQKEVGVTDRQIVAVLFDTEAGRASAVATLKRWAASPPKP